MNDIVVTAGNDLYHKTKSDPTLVEKPKNSLHTLGFALDFTTSKQGSTIKKLNEYVRGDDKFNYINEYVRRTENGTGDHFHITYGRAVNPSSFAGQQRTQSESFDIVEGLANFQKTEIPFKDIQKEYNAFIQKREQDFQSKKETEKANSFIPKSQRGKI